MKKEMAEWLASAPINRKDDLITLLEFGERITGHAPVLWGSIVGFGKLHYTYASGHQGDMPRFAFASRKQAITIYLGFDLSSHDLSRLGKHKIGKGCLYLQKLSDVNMDVLEKICIDSVRDIVTYDFITVIE